MGSTREQGKFLLIYKSRTLSFNLRPCATVSIWLHAKLNKKYRHANKPMHYDIQ